MYAIQRTNKKNVSQDMGKQRNWPRFFDRMKQKQKQQQQQQKMNKIMLTNTRNFLKCMLKYAKYPNICSSLKNLSHTHEYAFQLRLVACHTKM